MKEQRCQLLLLTQYLSIIDDYQKNIGLQHSIKFTTPYLEVKTDISTIFLNTYIIIFHISFNYVYAPILQEHNIITEKLNLLMSGDVTFRKSNNNAKEVDCRKKENIEVDAKLSERVQNVFSRHDMDFTDYLWEIFIGE